MKFEQTSDLIKHARSFHQLIATFLSQTRESLDSPRMQMLLDYLVQHEMDMDTKLAEYEQHASQGLMDTWVQFSTCEAKFKKLQTKLQLPETSVEEVIFLMVSVYDCLIENFELMAKQAEIDDVGNVFTNIAAMERKQKLKIVRNSNMIGDF